MNAKKLKTADRRIRQLFNVVVHFGAVIDMDFPEGEPESGLGTSLGQGIVKRVIYPGKGELPCFEDGTKVRDSQYIFFLLVLGLKFLLSLYHRDINISMLVSSFT